MYIYTVFWLTMNALQCMQLASSNNDYFTNHMFCQQKPFYSPLKRGMETLDDRELYCTNSRSTWSSENTTEDSLSTSFTLSQLQSDVDELCRVVLCLCESVEQMEARQKSIMQSLLCAAKGGINGMTTTTATDKQHGRIKALRTFSEDQVAKCNI